MAKFSITYSIQSETLSHEKILKIRQNNEKRISSQNISTLGFTCKNIKSNNHVNLTELVPTDISKMLLLHQTQTFTKQKSYGM